MKPELRAAGGKTHFYVHGPKPAHLHQQEVTSLPEHFVLLPPKDTEIPVLVVLGKWCRRMWGVLGRVLSKCILDDGYKKGLGGKGGMDTRERETVGLWVPSGRRGAHGASFHSGVSTHRFGIKAVYQSCSRPRGLNARRGGELSRATEAPR